MLQSALGALSRLSARHASVTAGELTRRSSRELGYAGLAQASGHRTPEAFLQAVIGVTAPEAARLVRVGSLPATSPLAVAIAAGEASVDAADAIRRGLGNADHSTSTQTLDAAARELLAVAASATPEALYRAAADARNQIDLEGVATRERERRDQRYLRVRQRDDGMVSGSFLLDQEDGQLLISAIDTVLGPRRGGPRFVCESERLAADKLIADPRTNDQLAADAFVDIIQLAVDADPGTVFGDRRPAVQVIVTAHELDSGIGSARIEGAPEAISIDTARRHACTEGVVGILFSATGQPLDVGRAQRHFTPRQRLALAARDGGCRFPHCSRPPSYCEAHHVRYWHRDRGPTDVQNGLLLCRHHHLLVHNNGWEIERSDAIYWLIPPLTVDRDRVARAMPSKNPLTRPRPVMAEAVGDVTEPTNSARETVGAARSVSSQSAAIR
ncbi:MAG: 13E12 repeat family protein [Salinibacterium sp.]|nr:13E12 repeat family protein [Salinibacterium sp.]